jgi:hypothetical protein
MRVQVGRGGARAELVPAFEREARAADRYRDVVADVLDDDCPGGGTCLLIVGLVHSASHPQSANKHYGRADLSASACTIKPNNYFVYIDFLKYWIAKAATAQPDGAAG